jgi:hypothetical protein
MKAMLIIDMPSTCYDCPCHKMFYSDYADDAYCQITGNDTLSYEKRNEDCPLKLLPKEAADAD